MSHSHQSTSVCNKREERLPLCTNDIHLCRHSIVQKQLLYQTKVIPTAFNSAEMSTIDSALPFELASEIPPSLAHAMFVVITLPHVMYASVFFNEACAQTFSRYHNTFMFASKVLKVLLALGMIVIGFGVYEKKITGTWLDLLGLAMLAYGAHLNYMVYSLLGSRGVYYGIELGVLDITKIVWVTGYPFSWYSHPQYFGSILNWLAFACLAGFDTNGFTRWDIVGMTVYACTLYMITIVVESNIKVKY
jgi:hypothetical protein